MKRFYEALRIMFDRAFWCEFIDLDMREEAQMMHEVLNKKSKVEDRRMR